MRNSLLDGRIYRARDASATSCSFFAPPAATAPMTSPSTSIGKPPGTLVKSAHPHGHAECIFFGRVAGRQPLRGRGDRFPLRGDDREVPRAVHHQESDQPAILVGHRETDLAAKRVGLR